MTSRNEVGHAIPYGRRGRRVFKPGALADYPGLWQRPARCLHFGELVEEIPRGGAATEADAAVREVPVA